MLDDQWMTQSRAAEAAGALVPAFGAHVYTVLPFLAAGAMAVSSVTVLSNSLLLFRFRTDFGEKV